MDKSQAQAIIRNAVAATEERWRQYDQRWKDIDVVFLKHGYEQQGFKVFRFAPFLEDRGLLSVAALGSILGEAREAAPYDPGFGKGLDGDFYRLLRSGAHGLNGELFAEAVEAFRRHEPASGGRFYWRLLWFMLQASAFLHRHHNSSFATYLLAEYRKFVGRPEVTESELLAVSALQWQRFLEAARPWKYLKGIGENVFDFIVGDVVEAQFANDSYKFDSANAHFLKVTGIADLITPLERGPAIDFMRSLDLPYTLREINKGLYTYCSCTEAENFGFCRTAAKCEECKVADICGKRL